MTATGWTLMGRNGLHLQAGQVTKCVFSHQLLSPTNTSLLCLEMRSTVLYLCHTITEVMGRREDERSRISYDEASVLEWVRRDGQQMMSSPCHLQSAVEHIAPKISHMCLVGLRSGHCGGRTVWFISYTVCTVLLNSICIVTNQILSCHYRW